MSELLLEVGVEEIPAWMIEPALEQLRTALAALSAGGDVQVFGTPRRLVAYIADLPEAQPDTEEQLTGPPKKAPQQAADAFAKKCGVEISKLSTLTTPKGEYWTYLKKEKGQKTIDVLQLSLPTAILGLHWPKSMYWTAKGGSRFIRPIRSILALFGGKVVKFEIAGVKSGDTTFGHRVLGKPKIKVSNFETYRKALSENGVILDAAERRARVLAAGVKIRPNEELVNTLVYLTEYPTAAIGEFDPSYLTLPEEVLSTVMAHHQKYLSVETPQGKLAPKFVFIMNRGADNAGIVRHGNERVLRARFNDARFFWDTDQKIPLFERNAMLEKVTFQAKIGTYAEKTRRMQKLAQSIAEAIGADQVASVRAAELSKCDLTTELVKEFTELQGIIGGLYARAQREGEKVSAAIYDHYRPESMDDALPATLEGSALSLADKLDTIASCFRVGLKPTGSKDPLGLRRAAQGVTRILASLEQSPDLRTLLDIVIIRNREGDGPIPAELLEEVLAFFKDRVRFLLTEMPFAYDEVNAVMAAGWWHPYDAVQRAKAVAAVRKSPDFEPLASASKRIKNILAKAEMKGHYPHPDPARMEDGAERDLYEAALKVQEDVRDSSNYAYVLTRMSELRPHVDLFFEKVMVMVDDERVRRNRLFLLGWILSPLSRIADISEIVTSQTQTH